MNPKRARPGDARLDGATREFYGRVITLLTDAGVPFLLGGAHAFKCYTGIARHTKDLDLFIERASVKPVLRILHRAGFETEIAFSHWLAKARDGDNFIDIIFSSGNGVAVVDREWLTNATDGVIADRPVRLCPAEEMIWSKSFIMERERFDGADVVHLLNARAEHLDWDRLLRRFDTNWRILLSHLVLFGYIYPSEGHRIPDRVMSGLQSRLRAETRRPSGGENTKPRGAERADSETGPAEVADVARRRICRGTLLSRAQYLVDVESWGFDDPRLEPEGAMSPAEIEVWTEGIEDDGPGSRPTATDASSGCAASLDTPGTPDAAKS